MAADSRSHRRPAARTWVAALIACLLPAAAAAVAVRPWEGEGDFAPVLDVVARPHADGTVSLVLLFGVPDADVPWRRADDGTWRSRLDVAVTFAGDDGDTLRRRAVIPLRADDEAEARSRLRQQVFTLRLDGVAAAGGELTAELTATRRPTPRERREEVSPPVRHAVVRAEWVDTYPGPDRPALRLHDPLFLAGAPVTVAGGGVAVTRRPDPDVLQRYLDPARLYGLGAERVQVTFDVDAVGVDSARADRLPGRLLLQLQGVGRNIARRDTVVLSQDQRARLAAGGVAAVTWDLDANTLPAGTYRLGCGPLDGAGNSWLAEFVVVWSLAELTAPVRQEDMVARIVLPDSLQEAYRGAGPGRRRAILADFWRAHDPDPATRVNEAELEFRRRMVYVARFLGGFNRFGPVDDRGLIYLQLGPPDEVQSDEIPLNPENLGNAINQVYDAFVPRRRGVVQRGREDLDAVAIQAARERLRRLGTPRELKAFELWRYDGGGHPLFPTPYTGDAAGLRFLFLARDDGSYHLEVSNNLDSGSPDRQ